MADEQQRQLDKVVDIDSMYGYEPEEEHKKEDKKAEILKAFLNHLNERKKLYLRKVE
jgi:hypothetical protein